MKFILIGRVAAAAAAVGFMVASAFGTQAALWSIRWIALPVLGLGAALVAVCSFRDRSVSLPFVRETEADVIVGRFFGIWMLVTFSCGVGAGVRWEPY